jgi:hypothetical protein
MNFNVHKWNKQRYLAEAGIYETATLDLAKEINKILPENLGYKKFAKAVARVLKDEYGSQNFKSFMNVLHDELGMEPLNEAETFNMDDDLLLSTYENKLKAHDWYYYMSDDSRKYNSGGMEAKTLSDIKTELGKRGLADKAKELFTKYEKTL